MQATTIRSGAETGVVKRYLVSGIYSGIGLTPVAV